MTTENKPMYGIWIPGKGWLKGKEGLLYADYIKEVAIELAGRIGNGSKVYFIDVSIADLESELLEAEKKKIPFFQRIHKLLKV